jgi:hypothetical protein
MLFAAKISAISPKLEKNASLLECNHSLPIGSLKGGLCNYGLTAEVDETRKKRNSLVIDVPLRGSPVPQVGGGKHLKQVTDM